MPTQADRKCHVLAAAYREAPTFNKRQDLQRALSEAARDPDSQVARVIWLYKPTANTLGTILDHWIVGAAHVAGLIDRIHQKQPFPPMLRWAHPAAGAEPGAELQRVEPAPPAQRMRHG